MTAEKKAGLLLEDGSFFAGTSFGAEGIKCGEVVFHTGMTGYQEIITDPSYAGQIVVMCYPHIGNYGVNSNDVESFNIWCSGLVVKEYSKIYSNHLAESSLGDYMQENSLPGIEGIDTRALVRKLREKGAMKGVLASGDYSRPEMKKALEEAPDIGTRDLAGELSDSPMATHKKYKFKKEDADLPVVAVVDYGLKLSILRSLESTALKPVIVNGRSGLEDILALFPAGVLLSNGPGDPSMVPYGKKLASDLIEYNKKEYLPVMGICMGTQLLGLAAGGKTFKLKYGHHGANHPVRELSSGKVEITSQNHNYCVDLNSLPSEYEMTHINLNDGTLEGFRHKKYPIMGCQHHPEAGPGPAESAYIFEKFRSLINA